MAEQMSYFYRQGVVSPINEETAREFQMGSASLASRAKHIRITPDLFASLIHAGLFDAMNAACGTLIDEYEEEELSGDQLLRATKCVDLFRRKTETPMLAHFANELRAMLIEAHDNGRPVYFIL